MGAASAGVLACLLATTAAAARAGAPSIVLSSTEFSDAAHAQAPAHDVAACCAQCWADAGCAVATLDSGGTCHRRGSAKTLVAVDGATSCRPLRTPPRTASWPPDAAAVASAMGSTHQAGCYYNRSSAAPFLLDGAAAVRSSGARVLKMALLPFSMQSSYPWRSPAWPASGFSDPAAIVAHPYVRAALDLDLETFVFTVYSTAGGADNNYWRTGITPAQAKAETKQFHDLAAALLAAYAGTGKTFVLSHWEGDWSLRGAYNASVPPTPLALRSMVTWLAARQAGVAAARAEFETARGRTTRGGAGAPGGAGVAVLHASEVNLVADSMASGFPNMVLKVLPFVQLDMVAYSAYDTMRRADFGAALAFIEAHHNRTAHSPPVAVYVGEFGVPQMQAPNATLVSAMTNVVQTALAFGAPYVLWWEVYCNELASSSSGRYGSARRALSGPGPAPWPATSGSANDNHPGCTSGLPVFDKSKLRGFWMVEPDGSEAWPFDYVRRITAGGLGLPVGHSV